MSKSIPKLELKPTVIRRQNSKARTELDCECDRVVVAIKRFERADFHQISFPADDSERLAEDSQQTVTSVWQ
ncbi:hypothetical protein EVAR_34526_1 [Eumeta japonica]|uniref:Uncharacterized protein n=1 Tax=Eumeta variegata TaxID=151549 RepID=A0A4C1X861_EUMVA|nr:hypothetical protein EVAR_34526_1 [Eumeta japonica]